MLSSLALVLVNQLVNYRKSGQLLYRKRGKLSLHKNKPSLNCNTLFLTCRHFSQNYTTHTQHMYTQHNYAFSIRRPIILFILSTKQCVYERAREGGRGVSSQHAQVWPNIRYFVSFVQSSVWLIYCHMLLPGIAGKPQERGPEATWSLTRAT